MGENGAGKSTLGKIIGGVYVADSGTLRVDDRDVGRWNPPSALAAGIATIQQELSLVPAARWPRTCFSASSGPAFGVLTGSVMERYRELDAHVRFGLPGDVPVSSLRLADQQKVEIMRALARNARLIVLDEPTSSLSRDESDRLHALMRDLVRQGRTLVYVSHFLDEVLGDRRHGDDHARRQGDADRGHRRRDEGLAGPRHAGPTSRGRRSRRCRRCADDAPNVFEARGLCGAIPQDIDLRVRAGEIVGLAGLVGSGRTELARMIAGADSVTSGEMLLHGEPLPKLRPHTGDRTRHRDAAGGPPRARTRDDPERPARTSRCRACRRSARSGVLDVGAERRGVRSTIERLRIVPPDPDGMLRNYSGGNQQKALFAKWTLERPRFIVLDEPTRGVDIGAKLSIYEAIVDVARSGTAVLLVSSELEEVVGLCHRIHLMCEGRIVGEVGHGELDADEVLARIFARHRPRSRVDGGDRMTTDGTTAAADTRAGRPRRR